MLWYDRATYFLMMLLHTVLLSFNRLGKLIGVHPKRTIFISLILSGSCLIGLMGFTQENRADKLWTPDNSLALKHKSWVDRNFPTEMRASIVLLVTGDVLTPVVLKEVSWYLWSSTTFRAVQSIYFFWMKGHWRHTLQFCFLYSDEIVTVRVDSLNSFLTLDQGIWSMIWNFW